ncbi:hypothetical protein BDW74DRAFT_183131 [Aspergillus multicolor]|uniref:serine protease n=1 Tax=Aspergillus multicolor TaxID=41759 RepID=UPI003CCD980C
MPTISELLHSCLKQFAKLFSLDALAQIRDLTEIPLQAWKDELGRLRVWAANIGAHQKGQSSLDYRLRDSSHIRLQTIKVLEATKTLLEDIENILLGSSEPGETSLDEELEMQSLCAELELDLGNPSSGRTELQDAYQSLVNKISQLFDISMTIRRPTHHDRLIGTEKIDGKPFEFFFHQHVSHKYAQAEVPVIDRISSAMAKQKAILKYRERHHLKLGQGLNTSDGDNTIKLSETIATSFHREETQGLAPDDLNSEAGALFTSYAGSLLTGHEKLGIPAMPKDGASERPFECPYCYFIITIKDRRAWARHIFKDLSPYICIFPDCSTGSKLYDSRKSWYRHVHATHLSSEDTTTTYECPLCKEESLHSNTFERHVGRHLEELALFVLPRTTEDEEESEDEDGDDRKSQSELLELSSNPELFGETSSLPDSTESARKSDPVINLSLDEELTDEVLEEQRREIDRLERQLAKSRTKPESESDNGLTDEETDADIGETADKKTAWIKVNHKYLLPETLDAFRLPWKWSEDDAEFLIIMRWVDEDLQDEIFAHTRRLRESRDALASPRVIGGSEAPIKSHPYQATLLVYNTFACGGSIIAHNKILTAAHCADGSPDSVYAVRAGSSSWLAGGDLVNISRAMIHPLYGQPKIYGNDIAVVTLGRDLALGMECRLLRYRWCRELRVGMEMGMGQNRGFQLQATKCVSRGGDTKQGGSLSDTLRAVTVNIIDQTDCEAVYKEWGGLAVTGSMFCAGVIVEGLW